jgi:hypothetical protein
VSADGTSATVIVPDDAATGTVGVVGDGNTHINDPNVFLQVVPLLQDLDVTSVASNGSSANVTLLGKGFIDGNNSAYRFGSETVVDTSTTSGSDVYSYSYFRNQYVPGFNNQVSLTLPLNAADPYGAVTITTAGAPAPR